MRVFVLATVVASVNGLVNRLRKTEIEAHPDDVWVPFSLEGETKKLYFNPFKNELRESVPASARRAPVAMLQLADVTSELHESEDTDDDQQPIAPADAMPSAAVAFQSGFPSSSSSTGSESAGSDSYSARERQYETTPANFSSTPHEMHSTGDCVPHCDWKCTNPVCNQQCKPRCSQPKCQTRCNNPNFSKCSVSCKNPRCTMFCPENICDKSKGPCQGPQCDTQCGKPKCNMVCPQELPCENICQKPVCTWDCKEPTACPKPECHLQCQKPNTCKVLQYPLPGLARGATVQSEFTADVADWETGEWSPCSADCGHGFQTRSVNCSMGGDHRCILRARPASQRQCEGTSMCAGSPDCYANLYGEDNFQGWKVKLKAGRYDKATLAEKGAKDEDVSSLKVMGSCCRARLYQHDNYNKAESHKDGWNAEFRAGEYTTAELERNGAKDDDTSSVHLYNDNSCLRSLAQPGYSAPFWVYALVGALIVGVLVLCLFATGCLGKQEEQGEDE
mmetsp:Transcript_51013/g.111737  ORF Transcript_51013/g.111737 Transcript_51013/m.111737 type:complete len:506 (+) Transcript_51013:79-1596(+)